MAETSTDASVSGEIVSPQDFARGIETLIANGWSEREVISRLGVSDRYFQYLKNPDYALWKSYGRRGGVSDGVSRIPRKVATQLESLLRDGARFFTRIETTPQAVERIIRDMRQSKPGDKISVVTALPLHDAHNSDVRTEVLEASNRGVKFEFLYPEVSWIHRLFTEANQEDCEHSSNIIDVLNCLVPENPRTSYLELMSCLLLEARIRDIQKPSGLGLSFVETLRENVRVDEITWFFMQPHEKLSIVKRHGQTIACVREALILSSQENLAAVTSNKYSWRVTDVLSESRALEMCFSQPRKTCIPWDDAMEIAFTQYSRSARAKKQAPGTRVPRKPASSRV
ncbi:MAG: hypothetical protein KF912_14605 [Phycisphaeraceae bacterium]|nr:hypothetical protein [Phycisphaeraceae bacterium]MBX3368536.1 hypothetical protein [Phycisphaeraceae bacterium]QYK47534.1 MAG: hypothetical protein KF838_12170 [Phycisphaeraceae bacterium]